ncbi:MAG TPA: phosphatase PAP2 family protein [Solirubrobacterales bacterium]|nr:phosphatase PAP2 family protein [Solirubrobacterales bacterium]
MARRVSAPLFGAAACLGGVIVVAFFAYKVGPTIHADASLLNRLSAPRDGLRFDLATVVAHLADPLPLALMTLAVAGLGFWRWGRRRETLAGVAVVLGANLTTQVLKHLFEHHRYQDFLGVEQPWANAFPSGHTTAAVSIAIAALLIVPPRLLPRAVPIAAAFAAAVGLAVVVIEWHYPSDVIGGTLVAAAWGLAALAWLRFRAERDRGRVPEAQASSRFAISTK